jgi:hypothetical protein
LVHPFEQIFEAVEAVLPEAGHPLGPVDQRGQGGELRAVVNLAAFVAVAHQASVLKHSEVFGDSGLRYLRTGG